MTETGQQREFLRPRPLPATIGVNDLQLFREVGEKMGISVDVLAGEGQEYVTPSGLRRVVEESELWVELNREGKHKDPSLREYWKEINRLKREADKAGKKKG